jgi:hypothetical protein
MKNGAMNKVAPMIEEESLHAKQKRAIQVGVFENRYGVTGRLWF